MSSVRPKLLSLFAGCGGFDAGFDNQGFEILAAHDIDQHAVETYNENLSPVAQVTDLRTHNDFACSPDVLIAGPPCQGFSTIGRLDTGDERNELLLVSCQIALKIKPKLMVIENVAGLTFKTYSPLLQTACSMLNAGGYHVELVLVNAEDVGLAQRRKRLFIVARSGGRPFTFNIERQARVNIAETIEHAEGEYDDDFETLTEDSASWKIASRIGQGQKLCNVRLSESSIHTWQIPEVFGPTSGSEQEFLRSFVRLRRTQRARKSGDADPVSIDRLRAEVPGEVDSLVYALLSKGYLRKIGSEYDLTHTFNGTYRRLMWQGTSPTVDTHFGSPRLFLHPLQNRGLSSFEASLLQGFPTNYRWPKDKRARFRLIGNAVPPPLARSVATIARRLL